MLVPCFRGQHDCFLFWSAHVKESLKVMRVWSVLHREGAASLTSHKVEMDGLKTGAANNAVEELARDVVCSLILQILREMPFSRVTAHQDDPRKIRELLHQRHSARTRFRKALLHSSLERKRYTGQATQDNSARRELIGAQLASMVLLSMKNLWWLCSSRVLEEGRCRDFSAALLALLSKDNFFWKSVTARVLQEDVTQRV